MCSCEHQTSVIGALSNCCGGKRLDGAEWEVATYHLLKTPFTVLCRNAGMLSAIFAASACGFSLHPTFIIIEEKSKWKRRKNTGLFSLGREEISIFQLQHKLQFTLFWIKYYSELDLGRRSSCLCINTRLACEAALLCCEIQFTMNSYYIVNTQRVESITFTHGLAWVWLVLSAAMMVDIGQNTKQYCNLLGCTMLTAWINSNGNQNT